MTYAGKIWRVLCVAAILAGSSLFSSADEPANVKKKPNVVVIMTDDIGWGDLGCYGGGETRGAATPHLDRLAKEGMRFTNWYGQASCTAGRASFLTGRIPIRTALSVVLGPSSPNRLRAGTPTIARCFRQNGYSTYMSGKWHLGDTPESYPTCHGFDEMKHMLCYYAGVYAYTNPVLHEDFPRDNKEFMKLYNKVTNDGEYEGVAGEKAKRVVEHFNYEDLATIDDRQRESAIRYLRRQSKQQKKAEANGKTADPFFMYVAFMKCHNPTNPSPDFKGKSKESTYLDSLMELDHNSGKIVEEIRKLGIDKDTIVVWTTDNGPWIDAFPDAGYTPYRAMKGTPYEGGWRVPGIMWWPGHIEAGSVSNGMMSHMDLWATLAAMTGLTKNVPRHGGSREQGFYFDSLDNSKHILGEEKESRRHEWIYINDLTFGAVRFNQWKYVFSAKDTWLGPALNLNAPAVYNLRQDPGEEFDMFFNGAAPKTAGMIGTSPGRFSGQDNGWALLFASPIIEKFTKSCIDFPNIETFPTTTAMGAELPGFVAPTLAPSRAPLPTQKP